MVKVEASGAKISWLLSPAKGQAPKTLYYISPMQLKVNTLFLKPFTCNAGFLLEQKQTQTLKLKPSPHNLH